MVPQVGQKIGPYEVLGRLGSGGMGLVYSAWDARLQRDVAIKVLRDEYSTPDMRSRFLQEARAASGLNHPHICTIFDFGEVAGDPYLVMELLKGETLRSRIVNNKVRAQDILQVGSETADALGVAHARGIIHRDIKPANIILVDRPGIKGYSTKVLDFGLAKMDLGDGIDSRFDMTSVGTTVGTVSYMSPEQARGEQLDARSDLFSLGIVLYEMATGKVPFQGATSALVYVQLLSHPPEPPREINDQLPKELERIILKLLEKERLDRFQTTAELMDALSRVQIKASGANRTIWNALSSMRSRTDAPQAAGTVPATPVEQDNHPTPQTPQRQPVAGNEFLRPIKRVVSSDPAASPRPSEQLPVAELPLSPTPMNIAAAAAAAPGKAEDLSPPPPPARETSDPFAPPPSQMKIPRYTAPKPTPRFKPLEPEELTEAPSRLRIAAAPAAVSGDEPWVEEKHTARWIVMGMAAVVVVVLGWVFWPRATEPVARVSPVLVLGDLRNLSGDSALDGVLDAGLSLDIAQSRTMTLMGIGSYAQGLRKAGIVSSGEVSMTDARHAAAAVGGTALVNAEMRGQDTAYTITARVYDVNSGTKLSEITETAPSRVQIPDALDRVAAGIRTALGESGDSVSQTGAPLTKIATGTMDALKAYGHALNLLALGNKEAAAMQLESAQNADAHFAQASITLSDVLGAQHGEIAAAAAALKGRSAAANADDRTRALAEAAYDTWATGDWAQAGNTLDALSKQYPLDIQVATARARILLLEGRFADALAVCQPWLDQHRADATLTQIAGQAMLGAERVEAAAQAQTQWTADGIADPSLDPLIQVLGGHSVASASTPDASVQAAYAQALDASGQMAAGLTAWQRASSVAGNSPELASTSGYLLAKAGLDRALAGECGLAMDSVRQAANFPLGAEGLFLTGATAGLCGSTEAATRVSDQLSVLYPHSYAVNGFYLADLKAIVALHQGQASEALASLAPVKQFDPISITAYLRGTAYLKLGDSPSAIGNFQGILQHRGAGMLVASVVAPLAQYGIAKAYEHNGDKLNAAAAYRNFAALWKTGDANLTALREARSAH